MGSYFFLLKRIQVLEGMKCSHTKPLCFNRKLDIYVETWKVFFSSGEVITAVMVQKAVSDLYLTGIAKCCLKVGKRTTLWQMIDRMMLCASIERKISLWLFLKSLDL